MDEGDGPSQIGSQSVALAVSTHARRGSNTPKDWQIPASSERPEGSHQTMQMIQMDGALQPGGGGTLERAIQDSDEKGWGPHHNWTNRSRSCGKNHGLVVSLAPSTGGHTPGSWGRTTTVDDSRNWDGSRSSPYQGQKGNTARWNTEQCVDPTWG